VSDAWWLLVCGVAVESKVQSSIRCVIKTKPVFRLASCCTLPHELCRCEVQDPLGKMLLLEDPRAFVYRGILHVLLNLGQVR
jgi:hypothetical protein